MGYVLVNDDDQVVSSYAAAQLVIATSVKQAAEQYGVSEGKLRQYLNQNGWRGKRSTTWEQAGNSVPPGITEERTSETLDMPEVPVPAGEDEVPF